MPPEPKYWKAPLLHSCVKLSLLKSRSFPSPRSSRSASTLSSATSCVWVGLYAPICGAIKTTIPHSLPYWRHQVTEFIDFCGSSWSHKGFDRNDDERAPLPATHPFIRSLTCPQKMCPLKGLPSTHQLPNHPMPLSTGSRTGRVACVTVRNSAVAVMMT